jgi:hypothetical protein
LFTGVFVYEDIPDPAIKGVTDPVEYIAVISLYPVFIVVINDLILDACALCQLVAADIILLKQRIQSYSYHKHPSFFIYSK